MIFKSGSIAEGQFVNDEYKYVRFIYYDGDMYTTWKNERNKHNN